MLVPFAEGTVLVQDVQRLLDEVFAVAGLQTSDREIARISHECKRADPMMFSSAYEASPTKKEGKTSRHLMAERLFKCWREKRGDRQGGVEGLTTWMNSHPTEHVSSPCSNQNGTVVFSLWSLNTRIPMDRTGCAMGNAVF